MERSNVKYEASETAVDDSDEKVSDIDESDYTPHYQRVYISGEETTSVSVFIV